MNNTRWLDSYSLRESPAPHRQWGQDLELQAVQQLVNACKLPVATRAALMPDAHLGYGLPIGGVLATRNAVIPYAVGVDIACRMMLSVFDVPVGDLASKQDRFRGVIERNTAFGIGASFSRPRDHAVMDDDWTVTPFTRTVKDLARKQLGSSGSGNHFVEFGEFTVDAPSSLGLAPGTYLALLSHSGSRGPGAKTADHYSRLAMKLHPNLPRELRHLAWLDLDAEGAEYWAAMEMMGKFASANHHVIHESVARSLGEQPLTQIENHHNFAWKEEHDGREVVVHRKGATPAGRGVLGIIPGSMASPAYVVEGLGEPASLNSAAHGAGRRMSRTQAKRKFRWPEIQQLLHDRGVTLISAGLDEVPQAYKNIDAVMAAQRTLVKPLARFMPRLVKMAPAGERPED